MGKKLTLDQSVIYEITVPGVIDEQWLDWTGITVRAGTDEGGLPISVLTTTVDQAALHGLLRRLYGLGIPLISVICTGSG